MPSLVQVVVGIEFIIIFIVLILALLDFAFSKEDTEGKQ